MNRDSVRGIKWLLLDFLVATWLVLPAFQQQVPVLLGGGEQPDWTGTAWTWWWTWTALLAGHSPAEATFNLFPIGLSPVALYNLVDGLLFGWLMHAVGPTRGYNLACGLLFATAGWTGRFLGRSVGASWFASAVAGVLLQCSTTMVVEVTTGRLSQALVLFLGLSFGLLLQGADRSAPRTRALWAGLFAALAAYTYWYSALFLGIAAIPLLGLRGPARRRVLLAGGVTLCLCAPGVAALVAHGDALPGMQRTIEPWMEGEAWTHGRFGLAMALAHAHQPAWPVWTAPGDLFDKRMGLPVVLLALSGVSVRGRWRWPLVATAVLGWLFTLGPWVRSPQGNPVPIPLPWLLFDRWLPYFDRLWWPERFEWTVLLGLLPLCALGVDRIAPEGAQHRRLGQVAVAVMVAGWAIAAHPYLPIPVSSPRPYSPHLYAPVSGPILTLPMAPPFSDVRHLLWAQVLHEQPVTAGLGEHLEGHLSVAFQEQMATSAWTRLLRTVHDGPVAPSVVTPQDIQVLRDMGLRWVVIDAAGYPMKQGPTWMARDRSLVEAVLGPPLVSTSSGATWALTEIVEPRATPGLGAPPPLPPSGPFGLRQEARGAGRRR